DRSLFSCSPPGAGVLWHCDTKGAGGNMLFQIDEKSKIPIYDQIIAQVIFGVASGLLEQGKRLPSMRELGPMLYVHPNTVARAYQKLEEQGVLTTRRGVGMEVARDAPARCRERRQEIVRSRLRTALKEAVSSALSAEDIRRLVE